MGNPNSIKVLIADDDNITRHLLGLLLRKQGYNVVGEAIDGMDAIRQCDRLKPDVLCLDINMPKMTGFAALEEIRKNHPLLVILMISIAGTQDNIQEALKRGANGFIAKPFTPASVSDAINKCFEASH